MILYIFFSIKIIIQFRGIIFGKADYQKYYLKHHFSKSKGTTGPVTSHGSTLVYSCRVATAIIENIIAISFETDVELYSLINTP
jgi:hypothetical protein